VVIGLFMLYIGIDISNTFFTASFCRSLPDFIARGNDFDQTKAGFQTFLKTIRQYQTAEEPVSIVMETTGVYMDKLCHYLYGKKHLRICVEPPQHIRRAFRKKDRDDTIDSQHITEYAIRYEDKLTTWSPPSPVVDKLRCLIASRELCKKHQKSHVNLTKAFKKKALEIDLSHHYDIIDVLKDRIDQIEADMSEKLKEDPTLWTHSQHLLTIKGIGLHCVCGFLVLTQGYQRHDYLNLTSLLGFSPRKHTSGSSVRKKEKTDRYGNRYLRKNLHLAAKNACQHNRDMKAYYERMKRNGKDSDWIYNNVSYKLLKIMCKLIDENRPYYEVYTSVIP
jgi:transposase